MILFEESTESSRALAELANSVEVDFEDLLDKEEELLFAQEDKSNQCLSGFYAGAHSERGLRCARFEDHNDLHMSDREEAGGTILAWTDSDRAATPHYLAQPSANEVQLTSRELDPRHPIVKFFRPWRHS